MAITPPTEYMKMSAEAARAMERNASVDGRRVCTGCAKFPVCMIWRAGQAQMAGLYPKPPEDADEKDFLKSPIDWRNLAKICEEFMSTSEAMAGV